MTASAEASAVGHRGDELETQVGGEHSIRSYSSWNVADWMSRSGTSTGRHHDGHDLPISRRHTMRVDSDLRDDASSVPASSSLELIVPASFDPEWA